jgi:hypothetical protein
METRSRELEQDETFASGAPSWRSRGSTHKSSVRRSRTYGIRSTGNIRWLSPANQVRSSGVQFRELYVSLMWSYLQLAPRAFPVRRCIQSIPGILLRLPLIVICQQSRSGLVSTPSAEEVSQMAYEAALRAHELFRDAVRSYRTFAALLLTTGNAAVAFLIPFAIRGSLHRHLLTLVAAIAFSIGFFVGALRSNRLRSDLFTLQDIPTIVALQDESPSQVRLAVAEGLQSAVITGNKALRKYANQMQLLTASSGPVVSAAACTNASDLSSGGGSARIRPRCIWPHRALN